MYTKIIEVNVLQLDTSTLAAAEASVLEAAIKSTRFNQLKAAKLLGISRGSLRTKLNQYFPGQYVGSRG